MPRVYPAIPEKDAQSDTLSPSANEAIAGFTAGVVSTLAVHPFDVVKTRLQVDQNSKSQVGSSLRTTTAIVRREGLVSGFYRGLTPNLVGNSVSWALYFMWYGNIKDIIKTYRGEGTNLASFDYFFASGLSGALTAVFTNPIWVIKTRMLSTSRNTPGAYRNIADGARHIFKSEGLVGFYRGLVPSLFGVSHGAIQFMAYEQLKIYRSAILVGESVSDVAFGRGNASAEAHANRHELSNWDYLSLSAASKIFAGSITYPYQVVRARLQTYDAKAKYKGATDVVRQVWTREGIGGFYKGLGPNIVRVLPSTCVTFLVYENTRLLLPRLWDAASDDDNQPSKPTTATTLTKT